SYFLRMKSPDPIENPEQSQRLRILRQVDVLAGGLVCAVAALGASLVAAGHSWGVCVPLAFSAVVLLTAMRFGTRAGIAGTLLAAVIFAVFLFKPLGKLHVASEAARVNLAWMLFLGVVFSFLFAPPSSGVHRP